MPRDLSFCAEREEIRSGRVLEHFRDLIRNAILEKAPGTEGTIIQAMILGDQKEIPKEVMEKFNRTGTTHIIAISGFNIGMVAVFALFLARLCLKAEYLLLRWNMARISMLFAILVVILYTFIAGRRHLGRPGLHHGDGLSVRHSSSTVKAICTTPCPWPLF